MEDIPGYVAGTFIAIVIAVLGFLYYAVSSATPGKKNITSSLVITLLVGWIFFVSVQTFNGYFTNLSGVPRLPMFVGCTIILIILLFVWPRTRAILMEMPITTLHYIHIVRVPVEMVLWWLAVSRAIPMDLTFEGSNLDIISGISAPFAAVFMVGARSQSRVGAIIWNVLALLLLIHIVKMAVGYMPYFYTPTSGGEIANLGVFYFPYVLLPTFIVPSVLFCHLVSLMQLIFKKDQSQF
ncbi:hypothetical protein [Ekhidna sp.]|uniref:hypothetical protein n=1 Tax=Ekhidna sp. TaxID=2608089 RepID=UPI00351341EF